MALAGACYPERQEKSMAVTGEEREIERDPIGALMDAIVWHADRSHGANRPDGRDRVARRPTRAEVARDRRNSAECAECLARALLALCESYAARRQ